jgi:NADH dehydrogenase
MDRILVLGGGFAGLSGLNHLVRARDGGAALELHLVDRDPCHTFAPALPDLISRRLSPSYLQYDLREHCRQREVRFTCSVVRQIDLRRREVHTDAGRFSADFLLIALGCQDNYFGDEASRQHALGLKALDSAVAIHQKIVHKAERLRGEGRAAATVVVGGGYTGYEAASHAAYYLHKTTGMTYRRLSERCPTYLVEVADRTLRNCERPVRRWSQRAIRRLGVHVRTGTTVEAYEAGEVVLTDGTRLPGATVVWSAGFRPVDCLRELRVERGAQNRLAVDEYLQLRGLPCVYAAGDCAAAVPPGADSALRMAVQFSLSGGQVAADNILRTVRGESLQTYRAVDLGYVVPLGSGHGAGIILGQFAWGKLPSLLHYFMCSLRSWSWRNRLGIARDYLRGGAK